MWELEKQRVPILMTVCLMWIAGIFTRTWKYPVLLLTLSSLQWNLHCSKETFEHTHKGALRRYNRGDAPVLSKRSLAESLLALFCGALLPDSPARINQHFSRGVWWPSLASVSYRGIISRAISPKGTDNSVTFSIKRKSLWHIIINQKYRM